MITRPRLDECGGFGTLRMTPSGTSEAGTVAMRTRSAVERDTQRYPRCSQPRQRTAVVRANYEDAEVVQRGVPPRETSPEAQSRHAPQSEAEVGKATAAEGMARGVPAWTAAIAKGGVSAATRPSHAHLDGGRARGTRGQGRSGDRERPVRSADVRDDAGQRTTGPGSSWKTPKRWTAGTRTTTPSRACRRPVGSGGASTRTADQHDGPEPENRVPDRSFQHPRRRPEDAVVSVAD